MAKQPESEIKPLCVDLFAGLHGWGEAFLAEGYRVVSFDLVDMCAQLGFPKPEGINLVLQDVLTLHGSQFKNAKCIVASPPCQAYSYRAMPWKRAKALPPPSNELFDACFRIQREACAAAGHHIPVIVENVCGAQRWVGKAAWHFGSFYLWGDVPALMSLNFVPWKFNPDGTGHPPGSWFKIADSKERGKKVPGFRFDGSGKSFQSASVAEHEGRKVPGIKLSEVGFNVAAEQRFREAVKQAGNGPVWFDTGIARHSSRPDSRKAASAMIAKIPFPLAQHIARCFK